MLDGVDVELRRGEVVLLEGENGSGKTTLLNILTGNLEADSGTIRYSANSHATDFHFPRSWLQNFNLFNRFSPDTIARQGFGRTWQDVRLFDSLSLRDNIAVGQQDQRGENPLFALFGFGNRFMAGNSLVAGDIIEDEPKKRKLAPSCSRDSANPRTTEPSGNSDHSKSTYAPNGSRPGITSSPDKMLAQLGLEGREHSSGDMISLGQSKRVAIARAIAAGAKVLFLDEPLAGLDRNGIDEVLGMLSKLVAEHELTIVIIEHVFNQTHLHDLVTTRWQLANGKIAISEPKQSSQITRDSKTAEQSNWFQLLSNVAEEIITERLPRGAKLTRFRIDKRYVPKPALEIKKLVIRRGKRTVIGLDEVGRETGFNLRINDGEIAILEAPNGWGKSSLVQVVLGLTQADSGCVNQRRMPVSFQPRFLKQLHRIDCNTFGVLSDPSLFSTFRVNENYRVANLIPRGSLASNKRVCDLSGGQRKMLALDIAIHFEPTPHVLILDEPFNALDESTSIEIMHRILQFTNSMATFIMVPTSYIGMEENDS